MHYYQFNIADYRKDTVHLSLVEHAIYRELIDQYHLDEKPISLDTASVMRRLRLRSTDDERALNAVLTDFFERSEDGWHHRRIDQEITAYHQMVEHASKAGKASAEARRIKANQRPLNDGSTNHKPITNNQEVNPLSNPAGFDEFWSAYPKRLKKKQCIDLWKKMKINGSLPAVLSSLTAQKASAEWKKDGGQYIPHPDVWLRNRRWEDEVGVSVSGPTIGSAMFV
jgi:uncharacterized protein YdaU (DUF1376 family)